MSIGGGWGLREIGRAVAGPGRVGAVVRYRIPSRLGHVVVDDSQSDPATVFLMELPDGPRSCSVTRRP